MIDNSSYWACPPDRQVHGWGEYTITVLRPPFPTTTDRSTIITIAELAPHGPARARQVAETFGPVDAVLEELPLATTVSDFPATRADPRATSDGDSRSTRVNAGHEHDRPET